MSFDWRVIRIGHRHMSRDHESVSLVDDDVIVFLGVEKFASRFAEKG